MTYTFTFTVIELWILIAFEVGILLMAMGGLLTMIATIMRIREHIKAKNHEVPITYGPGVKEMLDLPADLINRR